MKKVSDLGEEEVNRIRKVIEAEGPVEGDLRKDISMNINASSKSAPIADSVIAGTCPFAGSARTLMPVPAKVRAKARSRRRRRQLKHKNQLSSCLLASLSYGGLLRLS